MQAGKYQATIKKASIQELGANKTLAFVIEFETSDGNINWNGWMTEKAYAHTLDQLAKLQFSDANPPLKDQGGSPYYDESFFGIKSVEIVVEEEQGEKKSFFKVRWINTPSDNKFKNPPIMGKLPPSFKADLAAARARVGVKPIETKEKAPF